MSNSTDSQSREVSIVLESYPHTRPIKDGQIKSPDICFNFTEYNPISKVFDVMVEKLCYDVCEMAVVTFLLALDCGKPMKLIPAVMGGEFHHGSLWYEPSNGPLTPKDLKGQRVGVRAYTQTTGLWVRGFLQEQYGVPAGDITWVTSEAPHVAEYNDPSNVELKEGADLAGMVRSGELAAVVIGPKQGTGAGLTRLVHDFDAVAAEWYAKHRQVPINHMVVVTDNFLINDPVSVREIYGMLKRGHEACQPADSTSATSIRFGVEKVWGALQLAMCYAVEQKLISRAFEKNEIFGGMINYN